MRINPPRISAPIRDDQCAWHLCRNPVDCIDDSKKIWDVARVPLCAEHWMTRCDWLDAKRAKQKLPVAYGNRLR